MVSEQMSHIHASLAEEGTSNVSRLVIFDFDGVLVDSEIVGIRVGAELLSAAGYVISIEKMAENFSGMSWPDILKAIEHECGIRISPTICEEIDSYLDTRLPIDLKVIDGAISVLTNLRLDYCICSNTKIQRIRDMLRTTKLDSFFSSNVFSAKELGKGRSKPKPDIFLFGAEQMGFNPRESIVIEDSVHGVQAGISAGMRVIGFVGGTHTYPGHTKRLLNAGAQTVISHFNELQDAISMLDQKQ